jgi:hypothetical protein
MLMALTPFSICWADSWAAPSPRIFASENGERALKVIPVRGEKSYTSTATWIRLNQDGSEQTLNQLDLVNAPMRVLIPAETIPFFVTLDTHGSVGYEHTLVIYGNDKVVHDLKLESLLTSKEILDHVTQSVSSRWWRDKAEFTFEVPSTETVGDKGNHRIVHTRTEPENTRLRIVFPWGKQVSIKLATGEVLP